MKKIISLLLCLVLFCTCLVSCSDEITADDLDRYKDGYNPNTREQLELDLYIIIGTSLGNDTYNIESTVERYINAELKRDFSTTLDIHFLTEEEYLSTVTSAATATEDRADIVLIAGEASFDALYNANALADITTLLADDRFAMLGAQINDNLMDASLVSGRNFFVPNNHVVGNYEFVVVNKATADYFNYGPSLAKSMTDRNSELVQGFIAKVMAKYGTTEGHIEFVNGMYEDIAKYVADGNYCNISKYPTVTRAEAMLSGFAVVRHTSDTTTLDAPYAPQKGKADPDYISHYKRCMEVIYSINLDAKIRNILLYGYQGATYEVVGQSGSTPIVAPKYVDGKKIYDMSLLYTGDVFLAYFSEDLDWTQDNYNNGISQNNASVLFVQDPS